MLLGRLSLYGEHAARLHDEIIAVAARWSDPVGRKEPLKPYAAEATDRALEMLDAALIPSQGAPLGDGVQKRLLGAVAVDVDELLPHLKTRAQAIAARARERLAERGSRGGRGDARHYRGAAQAHHRDRRQGRRAPTSPRLRQREAATRRRQAGVAAAPRRHGDRAAREPARIRDNYKVAVERIEPVGIVYLWPTTG